MPTRPRDLRTAVDTGRVLTLQDDNAGFVARRRQIHTEWSQKDLFEQYCDCSVPFVTLAYIRKIALDLAALHSAGRQATPESEFHFSAGTERRRSLFAVLPSTAQSQTEHQFSSAHMQMVAGQIVEVLDARGAQDADLIFWDRLCCTLDKEMGVFDKATVDSLFSQYRVQTILRCSPEMSLVRLGFEANGEAVLLS